ncbi:MAG: fumarate reductase/succinate dehydrogenase flavoprotein subunit, partial [Cyanobacteria bacterium]|nr:fumarate reductase/succinate dehydrogenase flavoprotein subunit [Cyanobacteriota bacterium]
QNMMQAKAGIVRTDAELKECIQELEVIKERLKNCSVEGSRQFNPGWHLAHDLKNLLIASEALAKCALQRTESRGGHTRVDYPEYDPEWSKVNSTVKKNEDGTMVVGTTPLPVMPDELNKLFAEEH